MEIEVTKTQAEQHGFTGHTDLGDVTLKEENIKDNQKILEVVGKKHRVGHFKIMRRGNQIEFHHFWASDETTRVEDDEPETFSLVYDPLTLECLSFGVLREEVKFRFFIFSTIKCFTELIYGDPEKLPEYHWRLSIEIG